MFTPTNSVPLEEYALIANHHTVALISRAGRVDWFCPQVDHTATFAALLGEPKHGSWSITVDDANMTARTYLDHPDHLILHTTWLSATGTAEVVDYLEGTTLVRAVTCTTGDITVRHDLKIRTDYGSRSPAWHDHFHFVDRQGEAVTALHGPELHHTGRNADFVGSFDLAAGTTLTWTLGETAVPHREFREEPLPSYNGQWVRLAERSAMVLNALALTNGAILAAPTASLPEIIGGDHNWDYRFCWLRDSAFAIDALLMAEQNGYTRAPVRERAVAWRDWLVRTIDPENLQIVYGVRGETHLEERILAHLPGYLDSLPVRVGNAAASQFQADVVGEILLVCRHMREAGIPETEESWRLQTRLLDYCIKNYERRDHGIWEMRGELHYFTHGRAMMWAAFDCALDAVAKHETLTGDTETWRKYRDQLYDEIFSRGFDAERNTFRQIYDNPGVDASLLQLPHTGIIAVTDQRMHDTVAAIVRELGDDHGLIYRYNSDGPRAEYPFLICNFWLAEHYARAGHLDAATRLLEQLVGYANDLGLLAEEYDPVRERLAGNFPQAFSHIGVIRAVDAIAWAQ